MSANIPSALTRARTISTVCSAGCSLLAGAIPVAVVMSWAVGSWDLLALVRLIPPDILHTMPPTVQLWQRVTGAVICLVPALFVSFALIRARGCLKAFIRGDFFAPQAVEGLRGYASLSFWAAVTGILSVPLLSVIITQTNAPGHRELSLDLSGAQILNLLGAAILWVIASVMARASHIAQENAQFV